MGGESARLLPAKFKSKKNFKEENTDVNRTPGKTSCKNYTLHQELVVSYECDLSSEQCWNAVAPRYLQQRSWTQSEGRNSFKFDPDKVDEHSLIPSSVYFIANAIYYIKSCKQLF